LQEQGGAGAGCAHLRGALDDGSWLHLGAPHQGWRLCSVGHRHHRIKEHEQKLVDNDLRLRATVVASALADHAGAAGMNWSTSRHKYSDEKPRRGSQPGPSRIPRQYEPRLRTPLNASSGFLRGDGQSACFRTHGASEKYQENVALSATICVRQTTSLRDVQHEAVRMKSTWSVRHALPITSENPMMALSGVRSSWLILARNFDLAWLASSARFFSSEYFCREVDQFDGLLLQRGLRALEVDHRGRAGAGRCRPASVRAP